MSRMWTWCRRVFVATLLVVCCAWIGAEARQWLFRWRAERLLSDIRGLELNKSGWTDAQRLMMRWGSWGQTYAPCTRLSCQYQIYMDDRLPLGFEETFNPDGPHRLLRILDHVGIRSAGLRAGFEVKNGVVIDKGFGLMILLPVRDWFEPSGRYVHELDAYSSAGARLLGEPRDLLRHPNHAVRQIRVYLEARFTPEEASEEQASLMRFHFHCITRWTPCTNREEILPTAEEEYVAETKQFENEQATNPNLFLNSEVCGIKIDVRAREWRDVIVGDVVSSKQLPRDPESQGGDPRTWWDVTLHPEAVLKGHLPSPGNSVLSLKLSLPGLVMLSAPFPYPKVIVAGTTQRENWDSPREVFSATDCGTFDATPQNIQAAKVGVAEDFGARD